MQIQVKVFELPRLDAMVSRATLASAAIMAPPRPCIHVEGAYRASHALRSPPKEKPPLAP
jgi:hypothetical protein